MRELTIGLVISIVGGTVVNAELDPRDLDPPKPPALDYAVYRVRQLETQIATRLARLRQVDSLTVRAIKADINLRIIARTLLKAGIAKGDEGVVALLYGHTIANHADRAAKLISSVSGLTKKLDNLDDKQIKARQAKLAAMIKAIDKFNQDAEVLTDTLSGVEPAQIDKYLNRVLSGLAAIAQASGADPAMRTWIRSTRVVSNAIQLATLDQKKIIAMRDRVNKLPVDTRIKTELLLNVDLLRRAWANESLRPKVAPVYELMLQAMRVAEGFKDVPILGDKVVAGMKMDLFNGVLLIKDHRTRDAGIERFNRLDAVTQVVSKLASLEKQGALIDTLRAIAAAAVKMHRDGRNLKAADALFAYIDQVMQTMLSYRNELGVKLPRDLNKVAAAFRADYQSMELALLRKMDALLKAPSSISEDQWLDAADALAGRMAQVRRLHRIPKWIERTKRFKPRPTGGLFVTFKRIAMNQLDSKKRDDDTDWLALFEEQLNAFDTMPYEAWFRKQPALVGRITGETGHALIVAQLDRLKSEWITAWARGIDPATAAERLYLIRRTLRAVRVGVGMLEMEKSITLLNRWAAWEVQPNAVKPMIELLPRRVAAAAKAAGHGSWKPLGGQLEAIEVESSVPVLLSILSDQLNWGLKYLPADVSGLISQTLYSPTGNSYAVKHRVPLARISVYLMEAAHARQSNDDEKRDAAMKHVGLLAQKLAVKMDK